MKTLHLLRHAAKSSWKEPGLDDHGRPLSKRGTRRRQCNSKTHEAHSDRARHRAVLDGRSHQRDTRTNCQEAKAGEGNLRSWHLRGHGTRVVETRGGFA